MDIAGDRQMGSPRGPTKTWCQEGYRVLAHPVRMHRLATIGEGIKVNFNIQ